MKFLPSLILLAILFSQCTSSQEPMNPPVAEQIPKTLSIHGHDRVDPFYWMNERENPALIKYLEEENAYLKASLKHTEKLQNILFEEMKARIQETDETVPYVKNGYIYNTRYEAGMEYPIYTRRKGSMDAAEEILLDVNQMAVGYEYYAVTMMHVSPDNRYLAFAADTLGRYISNLSIKDLQTGEILPYEVPNITSIAWANDNKTLYYGTKDLQTLRADRIRKHTLGNPNADVDVYYEKDSSFSTAVSRTKSGKFISITSYSTLSSDVQIADADNANATFKIFQNRERNHLYTIDHLGDQFYILSNFNAVNFQLLKTSPTKTNRTHWSVLIPHRDDVLIEQMELFENHIVLSEKNQGLNRLRIIHQQTGDDHYVDFGEPVWFASIGNNPEYQSDKLRYEYESLTTPSSVFEYDMNTRTATLLKEQSVLGDFDKNKYVSERSWALASDGTKVPVSIVYKKGLTKDGSNPLWLAGYGSYGYSYDVYFSSNRLSLLDRGFVYAIAHIRGGQEMGRQWYEDGKLLNKMNTFTDFIAVAEHLVNEKYTQADRLFAEGASAGGLLMGAVANMQPDLFKGMIIGVPFVDVLTTMLDETIPLTTVEYDEWGNPNDSTYYNYMKQYSPYDNLEAKEYPAMLVTSSFWDSQVQYFEPTKYVAKLRTLKTDSNPLYLHTEMSASHGGKSGRFESLKLTALEYAFVLDLLQK
jgi:oligopeptidase B